MLCSFATCEVLFPCPHPVARVMMKHSGWHATASPIWRRGEPEAIHMVATMLLTVKTITGHTCQVGVQPLAVWQCSCH
jgi:hypothetical protein